MTYILDTQGWICTSLLAIFPPGAVDADNCDDQHHGKHGDGGGNGNDNGVVGGPSLLAPFPHVPPVFSCGTPAWRNMVTFMGSLTGDAQL